MQQHMISAGAPRGGRLAESGTVEIDPGRMAAAMPAKLLLARKTHNTTHIISSETDGPGIAAAEHAKRLELQWHAQV